MKCPKCGSFNCGCSREMARLETALAASQGRIAQLEKEKEEAILRAEDAEHCHKTSDEWRSHWQTKAKEQGGRIAQLVESIQEAKGLLGCICSNDFKNPEGDADKSAWKAYSILEDVALASPSAAAEVLRAAVAILPDLSPCTDMECAHDWCHFGRAVRKYKEDK